MTEPGSISRWIGELRAGRRDAADALWRAYYGRLVTLARQKLGDSPRRVSDEEDVVISAFHSFCDGASAGRFPQLDDRDDLWQVLVMLTARKAVNQRKHHLRLKRGGGEVRGDSVFVRGRDGEEIKGIDGVAGSDPSPEFAALVAEEYRVLLASLKDASLQAVAVAKMEGYTNEEIADRLRVSPRTVERKLSLIRALWGGDE